jgi:hypothetical protein
MSNSHLLGSPGWSDLVLRSDYRTSNWTGLDWTKPPVGPTLCLVKYFYNTGCMGPSGGLVVLGRLLSTTRRSAVSIKHFSHPFVSITCVNNWYSKGLMGFKGIDRRRLERARLCRAFEPATRATRAPTQPNRHSAQPVPSCLLAYEQLFWPGPHLIVRHLFQIPHSLLTSASASACLRSALALQVC